MHTLDSVTKNERTNVVWFMSAIFFLLVIMLPIGFLRRRKSSIILKFFSWGIYTAITALIPYVFGLMRTSHGDRPFPPLWAVVLVFTYGSVDKVNALDLNDQRSVALIWIKNIVHFGFAFILLVEFSSHKPTPLSFYVLCCLLYSYYKIIERVAASQYANGNDPSLASLVSKVSKFMSDNNDHNPLLGCKYIVDPRYKTMITLDKVLTCNDGFILSCNRDSTRRLKNTCLSFSLFWLLLHRFVGVPQYESSHQVAAWNFVNHGLLKHSCTSPFTVIEVELAFLYDFVYSKYFLYYMKGFCCQVVKQLVFHGLFTCYAIYRFVSYSSRLKSFYDVRKFGLTIMIMMELVQFIVFLNSRWSKMMLICMYLKRESWTKRNIWDYCFMKVVKPICLDRGEYFKPWQRKLGQYSLLESFSSRQHVLWKFASRMMSAITGIKVMRAGRIQSYGVTLTTKIQDVVIQSLQDHGLRLTRGISSIEINHQLNSSVKTKLIGFCEKLNTDVQSILVWHLTTSLCEINPQLPIATRETDEFHVATSLSKYCAYLVVFAPDLLPGHPTTTEYICTTTIQETYAYMKDFDFDIDRSFERYDRFMKVFEESIDIEAGQSNMDSILHQTGVLVKLLDTEVTDSCERWKMLAKFWAEMILYLAPNMNNECAHVERLADGGEFITHLWVLLFHAGIVDRNSVGKTTSSENYTTSSS